MSESIWKTVFDTSLKVIIPALTITIGWVYSDLKEGIKQVEQRQYESQKDVVTKADLKEYGENQKQLMDAKFGELGSKLELVIQIAKNKQ